MNKRLRGVVILYATIALAMLGVMGTSMNDGSQSTIDAVQSSTYVQLARYVAESGIEYAISAMNWHLVQDCPTFDPVTLTPRDARLNPACAGTSFEPCIGDNALSVGWADPAGRAPDFEKVCANGTLRNEEILLTDDDYGKVPLPFTPAGAEADVQTTAAKYAMSFRLNATPAFNTLNVYNRIFHSIPARQAIFQIRSRGMVRGGRDPNNPLAPMLLGHCTLVAKVRIGSADCTANGQRGGHARVQRICLDIVPNTDNDRPRNPALDYPAFSPVNQPH